MLGRIFGRERDEESGDCRKFRNQELHNLYSSANIVMVIKSKGRDGCCMQHAWARREMR
jgi:hypothetical protein